MSVRILQAINTMNRGGAEVLLMELYRHIDRTQIQFDFLIFNYNKEKGVFDDEIRQLGGRIFNLKLQKISPLSYYYQTKHFLLCHPEYSIIHSHLNFYSGYVFLGARGANKKMLFIAHSHNAHICSKNNLCIRKYVVSLCSYIGKRLIVRYSNYCMGCSDDALLHLVNKHQDFDSAFVMRNAINPCKFVFDDELRVLWREKFKVNRDCIVLGQVARFTYEKNQELSLHILKELVDKGYDVKMVFIGIGAQEDQQKMLAKELGVENNVFFLGSRGDVNELINAFDVFLFPSRYEGLGIVAIEAQANGLPCVMSKDVIPEEADVHSGLVTRVSLSEPASAWAEKCLEAAAKGRLGASEAQEAIRKAGYDIHDVAGWLQDFYLKHWKE